MSLAFLFFPRCRHRSKQQQMSKKNLWWDSKCTTRLCEEGNTFDASNVKRNSTFVPFPTRTCEWLLFICLHKRVRIQTLLYFSTVIAMTLHRLRIESDTRLKTQEFMKYGKFEEDRGLYLSPYQSLAFA